MLYDILLILYFVGYFVGLFLIFRKVSVAPWKALIPIYHFVPWLKICGKDWKWYLYLLIPGINIFVFLLLVVEIARDFRRTGFWEQLFAVIFPWIYLPVVGLSSWQYHDPVSDPPEKVKEGRDWLDSIAFALVAAVIIRGNVAEFYNIPSSSMEKSLLVGDYLLVSKLAYGPRVSMTPLAMPLVHNTLPFTKGQAESFSRLIQLPYHRFPGLGQVKRYDAIVFNYPEGDTACTAWGSNKSYYDLVEEYGRDYVWNAKTLNVDGIPIENHVRVRPVDKRENFIKRCLGLPGEDLQVVDRQVYINGKPLQNPKYMQQSYSVVPTQPLNLDRVLDRMGISMEDRMRYDYGSGLPLTEEMAQTLVSRGDMYVESIVWPEGFPLDHAFPRDTAYTWTRDFFGPIHIPASGETLPLDLHNLPLYRRVIEIYEGNAVDVKDSTIYINGEAASSYTFRQNYYWAMGDSRHNSADSRYWGFVPEDHIVGKASCVIFSWDKDHRRPRWNRFFRNASRMD